MSLRSDEKSVSSCAGPPPEPSSGNFAQARSLKRDLLAELRAGWEVGNPPRPEELLERWPGDPAEDRDAASVLFEDYLQRRQHGGSPHEDSPSNAGNNF